MREEKYVSSECNKMNVNFNIFLIRKHARFACSAPKYFHIQDHCFYCNFSLCALPEISHYGNRCDQLRHTQPMRDRDVHCKVITVAVHLIATVTQRIA